MAGSGKFSVIIRKELYGLCSTRAKYGASRAYATTKEP
eukprot:COSAG01_NODE_32011_length_587_cov_6.245902_1_plen_37_part_10